MSDDLPDVANDLGRFANDLPEMANDLGRFTNDLPEMTNDRRRFVLNRLFLSILPHFLASAGLRGKTCLVLARRD
jgi:hypothetical protein